MKVVVNPKYEHFREWITSIPACFFSTGDVIYDARNQIRHTTINGVSVCIKRFHTPYFVNRIIYSFFRMSKAKRAYQNALTLIERNIATPDPIAYILCGKGLLQESYLITIESALKRNFYEFGDGIVTGKEDILRAFAHYTAQAHEAQLYHLDYSPGNILFDKIQGTWRFEMIDINRMEINTVVNMKKGCKNFARLWGRADLHKIIAKEYALIRGFDIEQCQKLVLRAREKFWKKRPHPFFTYD